MIENDERMREAQLRLMRRRAAHHTQPGAVLYGERLPLAVLLGAGAIALFASVLLKMLPL